MEPTNSDPPPFWSPPAFSTARRRHAPSPPFISLPLLIILLPTLALILLFFAIRPFLSLTPQLFRPTSVKKSWDSFNVFLVLIAIICGIFVRRNDSVPPPDESPVSDVPAFKVHRESEFSQQWFSDPAGRMPGMAMRRLRRNSSYPDLRQESFWEADRPQFRFYDDFEINKHRSRFEESPEMKVIPVDSFVVNPSPQSMFIPADSFVVHSSPAPERVKSPAPPPPPPPPRKPRRTYRNVQKKEESEKIQTPPPPPPPPPPRLVIPPSPVRIKLEEKFGKRERKKTNIKKEIAMALGSLYKQRKRRKKQNLVTNPHAPPPPPPPPPPSSVFRGLFRKASKNKKVHSESPPPPPPPPPPSRRRAPTVNSRPPLPPSKPDIRGDSIRSRRTELSRTGSPEPGGVGSSEKETVFCPSPDVNIKAANFIARLRDEWRLEKMNSVRERERLGQGLNYPGPDPGPNGSG